MKKRLQMLVLVLVFLATIMALSACGYRPIQEYVPTEPLTYEVAFVDLDGTILKTERVAPGEAATAPRLPHHDGYVFTGWDVDFSQIDRPTTVTAQYVREWTVQFVDFNGKEVISFTVIDGEAAPTPVTPYRENFTFIGWDQDFSAVKSDMVIKATYVEDPKYTVEFWGFNGELLSTQKVYQGKDAMVPTPPAILHYTFKGWDQNTQNVTGNMTVNAIYEENAKFTVAFLDNLGNLLKQEVVYIGEGATAPEAPAVDNYTFAGWDKAFDNVQENLTVSATYTENAKFNVVFVDFDGTVLSTQVVYIGKNATAPADPSRENHDFAGWDKAFTNIQGELTVTALYNEHAKYTVNFVDFDGSVIKSEVVYVGKDATAPADPSRENFDFAGWNKAFTNVQGDLTVQALYNEHAKFTVTFLGKDGQVLKSEVVYIGKDATAPQAPAVENFDFAGWDKAFANIQGDLTVQALYNEHEKFTVTFVDYDGAVLKTETVYVGKNATAPADPSRENFMFSGWDKAFTNVQSDLTVTATYTEYRYFTVTFVDHSGNVLKTETVRQGNAATAPNAPARENHDFAGWDVAFDNVQGDLTVTAKYTEHAKYTVKFLGKDGQVLKTETVYVGKAATAPEAPAVENHDFAGWDKAFVNVQGDLTVTAKYTEHAKYTVTFVGMNGVVLKTETVYRGTAATAPEAPAVEGFDFKGWDIAFEAVTDDLTVTAIYEAQKPPVPTKLDHYKVMSWTLGGNAIYLTGTYGRFDPSFEKAVKEADPDIVILNGMGASSYTDPNFGVEGYSRWAYGEFADFRYTGVGYAILYKTDKFTPAGDVSYQNDTSYNGRNTKSFVMFPLKDTEGNIIPVVSAFLGTNHKESHREQLFSDIKAALGNDLAAAIIRIYVESNSERNEFISGEAFSFAADASGYSFKFFGGVDIKKDGEHTTGATNSFYYSCFLTYSKGDATVTDINVVGMTEDVTAFPNKQSNNAGFYTKAFTCIYGIPVPDVSEPMPENHTVTFIGQDGTVLKTEEVEHGKAATAPEAPVVDGYTFSGWDVAFDNVQGDLTVKAVYTVKKYTVTFLGQDGAVLKTEEVEHGKAASAPEAPAAPGFEFKGWDVEFVAVTDNLTVRAIYEAVGGGDAGDDEEYEGVAIRTQEDLAALANASEGVYTIINDLELVEWAPISLPAGVVLGGNGHTITGLTTALFSEVHGTVKNLKIAGANIVGSSSSHKYGVLANKLFDGAAVSHVDVIDCTLKAYYAGAIAAEATGNIKIEHCTVSGTIKQVSTSGNAVVGGILGRYYQPSDAAIAVCKIDNCVNNATITITSNNGFAGGIVAAYPESVKDNEMYVSNCINNGTVTITGKSGNAGGIFAYGYRCGLVHIEHCTNNAVISNVLGTTGGILGYLESGTSGKPTTPLISYCVNNGAVNGNSRVGGIAGNAGNTGAGYGFRIENCINHGEVKGTTYVGGIAGYTFQNYRTFHLIGSSNYGNVVGTNGVGGILGAYDSTSTTIKIEVAANYADVTATAGVAGGLIGLGISAGTGYSMTVTGFLQTGTVTGKVASGLIGEIYTQKTTTTYPEKSSSSNGKLYQSGANTLTLKVTACVLHGDIVGQDTAALLIGTLYGNAAHKVTFTNIISDANVSVGGAVEANPVHYYTVNYVATAGDADLVGTEYEGQTKYYGKNTTTISYMVAYEPAAPVANAVEIGAVIGGINASVNTEGSAAYILNQAAIKLGETYPTWKNGATYPEIQLKATVKYTVTFVGKDGQTLKTEEVQEGNAATAPEAPAAPGYTFIGWDVAFDSVSENLTVKAIYSINKYTVTFVAMDGTPIHSQEVEHGQAATAPEAPVVSGYTFAGWNASFDNVTSDITVTAVYTINKYTVTFLGQDGAVLKTEEVEHGKAATAPEAPAVENHDFAGWDVAFDNVQGDLTVKAVYTVKKYTVTFLGQDGAVLKTEEVEHGQGATAPEAPAVEGYVFKGWDVAFVAVTDNLTVRAIYEAVGGGDAGDDEEYEGVAIRTQEELAALANASEGVYTIINDLELVEWAPISLPAGVVLGGNGHSISGLTTALFSEVHGTVKNLKIVDANIVGSTNAHKYGVVANKLFDGAVVSHVDVVNATLVAYYAGGIAAEAEGNIRIEYSTVSGTIKQASTAGSALVGGFIGRYLQSGTIAACRIEHSTNNAAVTVSSNSASAAGFIANYGSGIKNNEMYFSYCTNNGAITITGGSGNAGGIFGYGYRCGLVYMDHCINNGNISNAKNVAGGLISGIESGTSGAPVLAAISDCVNHGNITGASKIGGLIGNAGNTGSYVHEIRNSVNYGHITGSNSDVGGLVGFTSQNNREVRIYGCTNYGNVQGKDNVGGILGTFEGTSANPKLLVNANYGNVTATEGAAGGLLGKVITSTKYTMTVTSFLQTGTVTGKYASAMIGSAYAQQYTDAYSGPKSYTIAKKLYKDSSSVATINITACVLSGEVIGTEYAGTFGGAFYGNSAPQINLKDVLSNVQVTEKGTLNSNPAAYYQFLYVATAGDADLVGTENEGKTAYYGRAAAEPSYMFAYECDLGNAIAHTLAFGDVVGGINASVETEGSAAYILNQAAIKLGDTYPTWKNGETYPEIQLGAEEAPKYTVTFVGKDGQTLKTEEVEEGKAATAPEAPAAPGYTFIGWDVAFDNVTGDITVTAKYEAIPSIPTYTVTFVGKDGQTLKTEEVEEGQAATAPEAPAAPGYTFSGWDVAFDNVQGDLVVKAIYAVKKYTVTFIGHGGAELGSQEVEHGKAASAPEAPAVEGYVFKGWDVAFEAVTDDLTVTAQYEAVGGDEGGDEVEGTPIENQEQLADLKNAASDSVYYLANDLNLQGWTSIALPSGVTLNGNGKTITGLTTPLFSDISGTVKNLTIADAVISGGSTNTGVVAKKLVDGSAVLNVHVVNCTLTDCKDNVGGIAGLGNGNITIQDCTVSGNIIATMGYSQVGGILGRYENTSAAAICTINTCTNDATISYTGTKVKAAGIIGECPAGIAGNEIHITNCTNNGAVTVTGNNGNAAGILGLAEKFGSVNIENCINNADISSSANPAGGIISKLASTSGSLPVNAVIAYCVNRGSITSDATAGVGGIVGLSTQENGTVVFLGCSNYGAVTGKNDAGGMLGQYTGKNSTFTFQAVANYGNLTANKTNDGAAGGLIGWIISGSGDCTVNVNGFLQNGVLTGKQTSAAMIGKVNMKNAQLTVNATACVLSGAMAGSNTALVVGRNWSTPNPIVNLDQVLSNLNVNHYEYTKALDIRAIQGNINDSVDTEGTVGYILNQASQQFGVTWKNGENYPEIQLSAAK